MAITELCIDDKLVRKADKKLRQYGSDVASYLNAVLVTVVLGPSVQSAAFPTLQIPTDNARRCIKAAKDIESGRVKAKAYTDMDEMMRDLLK